MRRPAAHASMSAGPQAHKGCKPVPKEKRKLECGHSAQSNCISPESPGCQVIEEIDFVFAWDGLIPA
jgi:hypothetical protein